MDKVTDCMFMEKLKTATEPSFIKVAMAIRNMVVIWAMPKVKVLGTERTATFLISGQSK